MKQIMEAFNARVDQPDLAKLLLRLTLGGLLLFHGIHKLIAGVGPIQGMLDAYGIPAFIGYGVLIGEVVAPICLILGIVCRPAALTILGTMVVAWLLVGINKTLVLTATGAWAIEDIVFYSMISLVVILLGGGRYSVLTSPHWR